MVRRDPRTGKFVSGGSGNRTTLTASVGMSIPAADLAGGTELETAAGDEAEFFDFSPVVDGDEVFILERLQGRAILHAPTTASAEGVVQAEWALRPDFGQPQAVISSPFWGAPVDRSAGIIDISSSQSDDDSDLWMSKMVANPSHSDTVNGLAAGADADREDFERIWPEGGPAFDRDDELVSPVQLHVDNVSDHAVVWEMAAVLEGRIQEV